MGKIYEHTFTIFIDRFKIYAPEMQGTRVDADSAPPILPRTPSVATDCCFMMMNSALWDVPPNERASVWVAKK